MEEYSILIFVQAAADLRHALTIYENNKGKRILICVVHVNLIYKFISQLQLKNTEVKFYPYVTVNMKKPFSYSKSKKDLKNIWLKDFKLKKIQKVYFFSRFYDWFTAGLIGYMLNENKTKIYYYEHYDDVSVKNDTKISRFSEKGLKLFIISKIISYISNVKFISRYSIRNIEFKYWEYPIEKLKPDLTLIKDAFLFNINKKNVKTILFLLSPSEIDMLKEKSIKKLKDILKELKSQNAQLVLKGHPRLGCPKGFENYFDSIIPNYIPSEFIYYKNIDVTIGIVSSGLNYIVSVPNAKVLSIIDFLEFKIQEEKSFYKKYLIELSLNKLCFAEESNLKNIF